MTVGLIDACTVALLSCDRVILCVLFEQCVHLLLRPVGVLENAEDFFIVYPGVDRAARLRLPAVQAAQDPNGDHKDTEAEAL